MVASSLVASILVTFYLSSILFIIEQVFSVAIKKHPWGLLQGVKVLCCSLDFLMALEPTKASFTRNGLVHTQTHIVPFVPKSGTLVGCVQTGTLQIETTKTVIRKVERYAILPFRSRLNGQMENMSTEGLRSRPNTKQNCKAILPFPCEQPICSLQKLERRWIGTIAFVCEHKLVISLKKLK